MMKNEKKENTQIICSIDEFEREVNLHRIISGGMGKGLVLLRKIADSIHYNNYFNPGTKIPSVLICGEGARTHAYALINSLAPLLSAQKSHNS